MLYVVFRMIVELLHLFVVAFCLHSGIFIRAKRVSNCYIPPQKFARVRVCSTNLGFSVGYACVRLILVLVWGTYYVPDTYVPGISRQKSIRTYVVVRMYLRSARGRTSDDSYFYQLSLVVATATASFRSLLKRRESEGLAGRMKIHRTRARVTPHKETKSECKSHSG